MLIFTNSYYCDCYFHCPHCAYAFWCYSVNTVVTYKCNYCLITVVAQCPLNYCRSGYQQENQPNQDWTWRACRIARRCFCRFMSFSGSCFCPKFETVKQRLKTQHPPWKATNHAVFAGVASSIYFTIFVVLIVGENRGVRLVFQHRVGPRFVANVIGSVTCWLVFRPWHLRSRSKVQLRSHGNRSVPLEKRRETATHSLSFSGVAIDAWLRLQ